MLSGPAADRRRCAVLGDPVAHSLSPVLHRAGHTELGLPWEYDARRVPAGGLPDFLAGLGDGPGADPGAGPDGETWGAWRGLSLTMPLKREAVALVDTLGEQARRAGAVNTLVLGTADGRRRVHGENTDVPGAVAAVRERTDATPRSVVVLGGGATATSTALAMCDLGARRVRLLVRDPARAAETVAAVRAHPSAPEMTVGDLAADRVEADVVVSTVPADAQVPDLVRRCAEVPVVFEVLYDPWPTPLARAALATDRVLVGGLDLLVHQAALQLELFTGRRAPLAAMRAAGEVALRERAAT